ncbi:MAG: hypothetical protein ACHQFZ_08010 [Acidimicrobiales bacterium]
MARGRVVSVVRTPGLARYVAARSARAIVLARAAWRLRRDRWWRRAPFLPLPDDRYWQFRLVTAYGAHPAPAPRDLVEAARWSLRQRVGR